MYRKTHHVRGGFDPRTVQPVVSRYTDCAIPTAPLCGRIRRMCTESYDYALGLCVVNSELRQYKETYGNSNQDRISI